MANAALWDMDGTLVDSEEYHWQSWHDAMRAEGVSITREQFLATFGLRNDTVIPMLFDRVVDEETIRRVGDSKEAEYRRIVRERGLPPLPGAAEWVARLHADGWLQAVASSAPRRNVEVVLEVLGLAGYFQALASAEDVTAGKPDPQVFLVAAARLGVGPSRCVVIEDAAAGIEAARRAGMRSIGVSRAGIPLKADREVRSLADLPDSAFTGLIARAPEEASARPGSSESRLPGGTAAKA